MGACLFVVATPIGNLADLSVRAKATLAAADLIAVEDTRHSRKLLDHYGISTPMISLHEHNEASRIPALLARLQEGKQVALISDAGTPAVSDPGGRLVAAVATAGIPVSPIPGPSAVVAAVSAGGLGDGRFWFEGFLPARSAARKARLEELAAVEGLLVFYVAPHRLLEELRAAQEVLGGERRATLARELTKLHETFYRGSLDELLAAASADPMMAKGELVLLVEGCERQATSLDEQRETAAVLLEHLSARDAAKVLARLTGSSRNAAYEVVQALKDEPPAA